MSFENGSKYRRASGTALMLVSGLSAGVWYFHAADTAIWQPPGYPYFNSWLFMPVLGGLFFAQAFQPDAQRFRLQTVPWLVIPAAISFGIAHLTAASVLTFLSNPSAETLLAACRCGGLLLFAYLIWIISFPIKGPADQLAERIYGISYRLVLSLGLILAIVIVWTLMFRRASNEILPIMQIISFHHHFQRLGVLVIMLLVLRICLPATLFELARPTHSSRPNFDIGNSVVNT
jgi:hypothetical protein